MYLVCLTLTFLSSLHASGTGAFGLAESTRTAACELALAVRRPPEVSVVIGQLRNHRVGTYGSSVVEPDTRKRLLLSEGAPRRRLRALAAQIRGIERWQFGNHGEGRPRMTAFTVEGQAAIRDHFQDLDQFRGHLDELLTPDLRVKLHDVFFGANVSGLAQACGLAIGVLKWSELPGFLEVMLIPLPMTAIGLFGANEHRFTTDRGARAFRARGFRNLDDSEPHWLYASRVHRVPSLLINALWAKDRAATRSALFDAHMEPFARGFEFILHHLPVLAGPGEPVERGYVLVDQLLTTGGGVEPRLTVVVRTINGSPAKHVRSAASKAARASRLGQSVPVGQ